MSIKPFVMNAISHRIKCDENIRILPLSDLHIGDANSNTSHIEEMISRINKEPNTYTILAGDLMNTAIVGSKSDTYSEMLTPSQQLERCKELFDPIAEKILAIVPGNHEERISKTAGIDITKILADELGIVDRYEPTAALLALKIGTKKGMASIDRPVFYSFYICHGHGGGRRPGGKLNGLADHASIIDADVIIQGHTHMPIITRQSHFRISPQNSNATLHEQVLINLPSAVNYGGYGKRGGYQPNSQKYPEIILSYEEHVIDVVM